MLWLRGLTGFVALAIAPVATWGESPIEEEDVLVLDEGSFEPVVKSMPFVLVEFYAPWCGHCRQFAPEFAAAAKQLKDVKPPVPLAKVDVTKETKIAEEYGIRGYPTIRLFVNGRDQEYTGGRTRDSIVTWVLKKVGPPAVRLEDLAAAEAFEQRNWLVVIGLFASEPVPDGFNTAARQLEDVMFAYTTTAEVVARYELPVPSLRMHFPHDERVAVYNGNISSAADIEAFARTHRQPVISTFTGDNAAEIFGDGRPILFLFRDKGEERSEAAQSALRDVASTFQRRVLVSVAGSSEPMDQRLMDYVGVEPEEFPTARLVVNPMGGMMKYKLAGEITTASLVKFIHDFEEGRLQPHRKSESIPVSQNEPVYKLVGATFDEVVKRSPQDVLVQFYAPWCGHCKKLEPIYDRVAKKVEGIKSLVIAKIDATANDVEGVDVEGFPTIKFWRADKKEEPLDYDGDRDVDSFIAWLDAKAGVPFKPEELRSEL